MVALVCLLAQQHTTMAQDIELVFKSSKGQAFTEANVRKSVSYALAPFSGGVPGDTPPLKWIHRTRGNANGFYINAEFRFHDDPKDAFRWATIFVWKENGVVRAQVLTNEERAEKPMLYGDAFYTGKKLVIAGMRFYKVPAQTASFALYSLAGKQWKTDQQAQSDYDGLASFTSGKHGTLPDVRFSAFQQPVNFKQPYAGPLVPYIQDWKLSGARYLPGRKQIQNSPFEALDMLAGLVRSGKRDAFDREVPSQFRDELWKAIANTDTVRNAPNNTSSSTFGFVLGDQGSLTMREDSHGRWVPVSFRPAN